jgi:hypothetical protein
MNGYQYNRACRCTRCRSRGILWPVLLITLGVLFLLDNLGARGLGFEHTWPVILLVIGGVKLLQTNAPTTDHIPPTLPLGPPVMTAPTGDVQPPSGEVRNV